MSFTVISVSENLPRFVARKVSERGGKDFSDLIVVFPTVRLGQHFRMELGLLVGACLAPRIMTLNSLIDFLSPPGGLRAVSSIERLLLLRSLLEEGEYRHLGSGMEGIISDFFKELSDAGLIPDEEKTFVKLETAFRENPFGSESYASYWLEFVEELRVLSCEYRLRLNRMGLSEPDWEIARKSRGGIDPPGEELFICGFYDATPVQILFLKEVAPRAEFIYQAEDSPAFAPVIEFAARLGHQLRPATPPSVPSELTAVDSPEIRTLPNKTRGKFKLYSLPSLTAEAKQAKYESLKALIADKSVMVIIPRRPEYVNVFTAVFSTPVSNSGQSVPGSNALARKCFEDPAVQLLQSLLRLASSDFSSYALSGFLLTPGGMKLVAGDPGEAVRLGHQLRMFLSEECLETYSQLVAVLKSWLRPRDGDDEELLGFLERLRGLLNPFMEQDEEAFSSWAEKTQELFIRCCRLFPPADLEAAARSRVLSALRGIIEAERYLKITGLLGDFIALAKKYIFSADVYTTPEPLRGVQLVHILEARAVPAEVIILCGMNEGNFPAALPNRLIEDPFIREKLGLLTAEHLEALEELNFFSLILQAKKVILTRCPQALKEEEAESRFITRLRLAGCDFSPPIPVGSVPDNYLRLYRLGQPPRKVREIMSRVQMRRPEGFFPGSLPRTVPMNAFRCEMFLNCPVRFFLDLWGVESGPEVLEPPDSLYEGSTLHEIAAALWKRYLAEGGDWGRSRLEEGLRELGVQRIPDIEVLAYLRLMMNCGGWKRFGRSLEEMLSRWQPYKWEKVLETQFQHKGHTFHLKGRADFVGKGREGDKIAVDFKRKNYPSKKDVMNFLKPQLPFYSFCLRAEDMKLSHLGYCSFLKKKGGFDEMKEEGLGDKLVARLKETAEAIVAAGGFACRPDEKYCQYCPYAGVCRVDEMEI